MNLGTQVLDLSAVLGALASYGGVSGVLSVARILFLDQWISRLSSARQNAVLVLCSVALNFAAILLFSWLFGMAITGELVRSAVFATIVAAAGSHGVYIANKASVTNAVTSGGVTNDVKTEQDDVDPTQDGDDSVDASSILGDEPVPPPVAPAT